MLEKKSFAHTRKLKAPLPGTKVPGKASIHAVGPGAPPAPTTAVCEYVPAVQFVHDIWAAKGWNLPSRQGKQVVAAQGTALANACTYSRCDLTYRTIGTGGESDGRAILSKRTIYWTWSSKIGRILSNRISIAKSLPDIFLIFPTGAFFTLVRSTQQRVFTWNTEGANSLPQCL